MPIVSAVFFFVRDADRTAAFYGDVLGFDLQRLDTPDGEMLLASSEAGGPELVFMVADEPAGRSPVVVFGLADGIERAVEALARHDVEIVSPVGPAPDGGLTADFLDPDGHVLSYHQLAKAE